MINLIPQPARSRVTREYWIRVVTVWLFTLSFALIVITALLVPTYITITSQIKAHAINAEAAISEVDDYNLSSVTLTEANKQAQLLLSNRSLPSYTSLIKKFETARNDGITITRLAFQIDGVKLKPITISGKATTRESLAQFRETLLNDPEIETAFLPISNLTQDRDISFLITVTMKAKG